MDMMVDSLSLKLETHLKPFKIQVTMVDSLITRIQNPKTLANPKLGVPSLPSLELTK
jgi:hypothetical protein